MTETFNITTERVADIPLLLAEYKRLGAQPLLDKHFRIHGNWQGLSFGWLSGTWLTHILVSVIQYSQNQRGCVWRVLVP